MSTTGARGFRCHSAPRPPHPLASRECRTPTVSAELCFFFFNFGGISIASFNSEIVTFDYSERLFLVIYFACTYFLPAATCSIFIYILQFYIYTFLPSPSYLYLSGRVGTVPLLVNSILSMFQNVNGFFFPYKTGHFLFFIAKPSVG